LSAARALTHAPIYFLAFMLSWFNLGIISGVNPVEHGPNHVIWFKPRLVQTLFSDHLATNPLCFSDLVLSCSPFLLYTFYIHAVMRTRYRY
ncbi:hypothetical protein GGR50DRAFT_654094, partial [Xylaria sp. CBS 124048]